MSKRIGINFHEGLQLSRARLATVLRFLDQTPGASREEIRQATDLGANMVIAMPNLGAGAGFVRDEGKGKALTALGQAVVSCDPYLERSESWWLIHFGLVDPSGTGPLYWSNLFLQEATIGSEFEQQQLIELVAARESVMRAKIQIAVSKFTDAYTKDDLLGPLGLVKRSGDTYTMSAPTEQPTAGVLAYATAKRWQALHSDQLTTAMETFLSASRLTDVFRISREQLQRGLEDVRGLGLIDLYTSAPPYQIVRRWNEMDEVIKIIYGN